MTLQELELDEETEEKPKQEPVIVEVKSEEKKKKKDLWDKVFNKNKLKKPNRIAVIFLRNNGNAVPMEVNVREGFFNIEGKTYHEKRDCIYTMGKERIPLAIVQEWSMFPVGTRKYEDQDLREKFSQLQEHAMRGIRHDERVRIGDTGVGKTVNMKTMILGIIIANVVVAVVMNYL